jgi:hypothetical protein
VSRYVDSRYEEVQASIQRGMNALARRRRLPCSTDAEH